MGSSSTIWSELQGSGQTGRSGSMGISFTELGSQLQEPIDLSFFFFFGNIEAVIYAEVVFIR